MSVIKRRKQAIKRSQNVVRYVAEAVKGGRISPDAAKRQFLEEWKP